MTACGGGSSYRAEELSKNEKGLMDTYSNAENAVEEGDVRGLKGNGKKYN